MSRGERVTVAPNIISASMRQNYNEYGVDEYYKKVGATYRNPHYPGIRSCMYTWLNRWWELEESQRTSSSGSQGGDKWNRKILFDMACGSGEVTEAFKEWFISGRSQWQLENTRKTTESSTQRPPIPGPRSKLVAKPISPDFLPPLIAAGDPYTAAAYTDRTSYPCSSLSFREIGNGALPDTSTDILSGTQFPIVQQAADDPVDESGVPNEPLVEMVVCSFALHLILNPSELFSLLWELSTKTRWLVVLAPHKKPEIKEGWGWQKWDISSWTEAPKYGQSGELLNDRVHCRAYRSTHFAQ
ncbi:hypothetical protein FA13DRAFT_1740667 [Coprinellus micaceus]|uniref:Uncharacterized protein n=1 Tax=Coprinellus micaceus TaxID=71717 RepID=A0A4Y7SLH6_COPMI|nr:hypothetical protein FA13DRAFT_1740667 [Coprinellus micaceus]